MSASRLGALYLLALAVPLSEAVAGLELARGSYAALALLPWVAFATTPRRMERAGGGAASAPATACLSVPPLALAAGLDRARGISAFELGLCAGTSWLALLLWTLAAEQSVRTRFIRQLYGLLWFLLVPLGLALRIALAWIPSRAPEASEGPAWLALDPLLFCHRWGRAGGLAEARLDECAIVLLGAVLAWLSTRLPTVREQQEVRV